MFWDDKLLIRLTEVFTVAAREVAATVIIRIARIIKDMVFFMLCSFQIVEFLGENGYTYPKPL